MKNPFVTNIPFILDTKIRWRLLVSWWKKSIPKQTVPFGLGVVLPIVAIFLINIFSPTPDNFNIQTFILAVEAAEAEEITKAETGIYYTERIISEGIDKDAFVATTEGSIGATKRIDHIKTYQHNETAIIYINSNETKFEEEVFLKRYHGDDLQLHHHGAKLRPVTPERAVFDNVHDLASLYSTYTSLEHPSIPLLPAEAEFVSVDKSNDVAVFETKIDDTITLRSQVSLDTKLVVTEHIFVRAAGKNYEMTTITYLERNVLPAQEFDTIFDPTQLAFTFITSS
jgi:hypothetical protein